MHPTLPLLARTDFPRLRRQRLDTLQVNLGYRCNQRRLHCHVNAGPHRTETMAAATVDLVVQVLDYGCTAGQGSSCAGALATPRA